MAFERLRNIFRQGNHEADVATADTSIAEPGEEKSHRIMAEVSSPWDEEAGVKTPTTYGLKELLGVYGEGQLANVWVFRAVRAISEAIAQLPLYLQRQNSKGEWDRVTAGPLPRLFEDINPVMTYYDFMEASVGYQELTGNVFHALEDVSKVSKVPRQIWPIRPDLVRIHPDEKTGQVVGHSVHLGEGKKPIEYGRNEMIHFKYFNPLNWYWGLSPLAAFRMGLTFEYYTKEFENNFFKYGVRETGVFTTTGGGTLSDKAFNRMRLQLEARHSGIDKMNRLMLLENIDWKRISVPPKDMEFLKMKEWGKDEVQAIYNIPPLKLMDLKEASVLANADIQERLFWSDCIIPRLKKWEGYWGEFLLPFFFKRSELRMYRFRFDMSEVRSLQMDEDSKSKIVVRLTTGSNPIWSPDEARDRLYNMPPAPWGGKEPLVNSNLVPAGFLGTNGTSLEGRMLDAIADKLYAKLAQHTGVRGLPSSQINADETSDEAVENEREAPDPRVTDHDATGGSEEALGGKEKNDIEVRGLPKSLIVERGQDTVSDAPNGEGHGHGEAPDNNDHDAGGGKEHDPYSEDYIHALVPAFPVSEEEQAYWKAWAIKRLKEEDRYVRAVNLEFRRELNETLALLKNMEEAQQIVPATSLLYAESRAIKEMTDIWNTQFGFVFRDASAEEIEQWGLVNVVDFDSPTVIEYGTNQASWFAGTGRENLRPGQYPGVTGTQLNALEAQLNAGLHAGESIPELTERVQRVFAGTIRETGYAARRIARTETIRAANFARLTQYSANRHIVEKKQWLAQLDSKTDEICAILHGETVGLDSSFPGGYWAPPDPHSS